MSTVKSFSNIPLGGQSPLADNDAELSFARESINWWAQEVMQAADLNAAKDIFAVRAGSMLLACKYMVARIGQIFKSDQEGVLAPVEAFALRRQLESAAAELNATSVVKSIFARNPTWSSLTESVHRARALLRALKSAKGKSLEPIPVEKFQAVRRVWRLVSLYQEIDESRETIHTREVTKALSWLDKQLSAGKRANEGDHPQAPAAQRPKIDATGDTTILSSLVVHEVDFQKVKRYVPGFGVVPTREPLISSPHVVSVGDMTCLLPGQWLNDIVVDAYMALVCHHANGHFAANVDLPGSPKWHAWNAFTIKRVRENKQGQTQWPPVSYPHATLEDVEMHWFPFCEASHWMLVVVYREQSSWQASLFSSKAGYESQLDDAWRMVRSLFHQFNADLSAVQPTKLDKPRQDNDADCGAFVLAIARRKYEGWALDALTPDKMHDFRHRIIVEMEDWRLSKN